ncbi:MAG: hypothetical protein C4335_13040 [Armatimonadota bacterium]
MDSPRIGILGGYGRVGDAMVRLLLEHTDARLVIAGRNPRRARETAQQWNLQCPGERVCGVFADASCAHSLWEAFEGMHLLVVAAPVASHTETVARAALRLDCDYLDVVFSTRKHRILRALAGSIAQAGRTFITDAGYPRGFPPCWCATQGASWNRWRRRTSFASLVRREVFRSAARYTSLRRSCRVCDAWRIGTDSGTGQRDWGCPRCVRRTSASALVCAPACR